VKTSCLRGEEHETADTAQVCLNGHRVTSTYDSAPESRRQFCTMCGAPTITACPACGARIKGDYRAEGVFNLEADLPLPLFCDGCGKPYPWTASGLRAARELADEIEGLSSQEREQLKHSLDDLVADTPRTGLAVVRFKKLAAKAGQGAAQALKQILVALVTDAARKQIWPS